jgi:hypothetical protein
MTYILWYFILGVIAYIIKEIVFVIKFSFEELKECYREMLNENDNSVLQMFIHTIIPTILIWPVVLAICIVTWYL